MILDILAKDSLDLPDKLLGGKVCRLLMAIMPLRKS